MIIQSNATDQIDLLKVYFGLPYQINEKIILNHPTIQDIIDYGERKYFTMVHEVTSISSDYKSELYDKGLDWEEVEDIEMFYIMTRGTDKEKSKILFGELDLSEFEMFRQKDNNEIVLYNQKDEICIDKRIYMMIQGYITSLHRISKNPEFAGNKRTKEILIEDDRIAKKRSAEKPWTSILMPLISSMVNHHGFKYNLDEVRSLPLFAFMDSVTRISAISTSNLVLQGIYSGNVDKDKVDKSILDWTRDLYKQT